MMRVVIRIKWSILVMSMALLFCNCHQKRELIPELEPLPMPKMEMITNQSFMDAPVVYYRPKGKVEVLCLMRNENFEPILKTLHYSTKDDISVDIYSNEIFQFKVPLRPIQSENESKFESVDTVMAISDVEGSYTALVSWLKGNHVITSDFKWNFGKNHLVFNGDMMDRGREVFQILWLIYKLEHEAERAGGKVHLVLGNHEQLNLLGQFDDMFLRYVHKDYLKNSHIMKLSYQKRVSNKTELGRWLRTKNAIVQINDVIYTHGGLSKNIQESSLTIQQINDINRSTLDLASRSYDSAQMTIALDNGPLWYRGMADQQLSQDEVEAILAHFGGEYLVIGHTIVDAADIVPLYNGKVLAIDLHHEATFKNGIVKGLLIYDHKFYEIDNKAVKRSLDRPLL